MILLHYRSFLIVSVFLLSSLISTAQENNFNRWSVEVTTGIHVPLEASDLKSRLKYVAFKQFELAGRYMFTEKFGIKGHYGFNSFSDPNKSEMGISLNRVGFEGVANIDKLFNINYRFRERFGLLFHTGVGVTLGKPTDDGDADYMGNLMMGFTGQIKLSGSLTLLGDITYIKNLKQDYGFNGVLLDNSAPHSFVNVSIGIMFSLGQANYHADWY